MMKLKKLLKELPAAVEVRGPKDIEIRNITSDSRVVGPGHLFIAKKGLTSDGSQFIPEAIAAGAVAILTDMYDPTLKTVTQLIYPDVASIEGLVAAEYYERPSNELFITGITGTNGKTTTATLVKYLMDTAGAPCGLIGTIEYLIGDQRFEATRTTPEVISNHKMLRDMLRHHCTAAVMEVTSHGLMQGRVDQITYDVAIFTNLTVDHLDYHKTMDAYCDAKSRLFSLIKPTGIAVVNCDDPWYSKIVRGCTAPVIKFGLSSEADLQATDLDLRADGSRFTVRWKGESARVDWRQVGRYNVYNLLGALGAALHYGRSLKECCEALSSIDAPSVSGRLQPVTNKLGISTIVDFAHTPDALENVLKTLREVSPGKLITVFGCGGDRDATKRPQMGGIAEKYSDLCIITSDNPRSEDPAKICQQIAAGLSGAKPVIVELDRRKAIREALLRANAGDTIVVAGKGHETRQIFAHHTIPFDDRVVLKEEIDALAEQGAAN